MSFRVQDFQGVHSKDRTRIDNWLRLVLTHKHTLYFHIFMFALLLRRDHGRTQAHVRVTLTRSLRISSVQLWGQCWLIDALSAACKHKHVISDGFHHTYPPWQESKRKPPRLLSALYSPAPGLFGNEWQVCVNVGADMSQAPICSPRGPYWEFSPSITPRRKQFLLPILPHR